MIVRTLFLTGCAAASILAQPAAFNIPAGQQPMAVAVNESTGIAYVANHNSSTLTVIDGKTRTAVATVKTGSSPEAVGVNAVTNRIYTVNAGENSVSVVDGATNTLVATVKTGSNCNNIAVNPATNKVYVTNNFGHSVTVIDGATNTPTTIRVGQGPRGIAVNPVTNKVYTANYGSKDSTEIDGATGVVRSIPTGRHPWAIATDTRANKIYVVNEDSAAISIIDGASGVPKNVNVGDIPFAVAVNPGKNRAYVLTYSDSTMVAIDGRTGNVLKTLTLPARPSAIAVNRSTNQVFVAAQSAGKVFVVDGETYDVVGTANAGVLPYSMAIDASANQLYVANFSSASATLIDVPKISAVAPPKFRVVALAERGSGDHQSFVDAARAHLDRLAAENDFTVDYVNGTERITKDFLARYKLIVQLNYPPYHWAPRAKEAFVDYITQGKGGWVGFHHASLLGEFDGYPMDPWFSDFLGGIRFKDYLPDFAKATVRIEDPSSPLAKGLPSSFVIDKEEWYTWSKSPRANVSVLASVDESSYVPDTPTKMGGDHPVIWSNPHYKARNVYIFMGHQAWLFDNPNFAQLFRNAIFWGAGQ